MFSELRGISSIEQIPQTLTNLVASGTGSELILSPKSMFSPIGGLYVTIGVSVVNGSTAISSGTVGDFISEFKIMQGTKTLLNISNIRELQDFFHIKTGTTLNDVNIPTTASTTDTASLSFKLPYFIALGSQVSFHFRFNGYNNAISGGSVTSGTATISMSIYYVSFPVSESEMWEIVPTPTALASNTDVNLGNYTTNGKAIYEMWLDITNDSYLNEYKFEQGRTLLYNSYLSDLVNLEVIEPQYSHFNGLLLLPIQFGVVLNTASNSQSQALVNLNTSEQVILFYRVQ